MDSAAIAKRCISILSGAVSKGVGRASDGRGMVEPLEPRTLLSVVIVSAADVSDTLVGVLSATAPDAGNYLADAPVVTDVSPASGQWGDKVTITGTGFTGAEVVRFGGIIWGTFTIDSDTQITATVPVEVAGTVDVRVTTGARTSATSPAARFTCGEAISPGATLRISGTAENDRIVVSLNGDVLVSRVNGVKTRTLMGGVTALRIIADAGDDTVVINPGVMGVVVLGGPGNDTLSGGDGHDRVKGGIGNDLLHGGGGNDWVLGGAGNDTVYGDAGLDFLNGLSGRDVVHGGGGDDTFRSDDREKDTLFGDDGADTTTIKDLFDIQSSIEEVLANGI